MRTKNGKLVLTPADPAKPKSVIITITKEQVAGIVARQQTVDQAKDALAQFMSGVVGGHGYGVVQVVSLDGEKRALTILPQ